MREREREREREMCAQLEERADRSSGGCEMCVALAYFIRYEAIGVRRREDTSK